MPHKAFITNTHAQTLKKRLTELIEHSQELKFLVGFFYFSGWSEIYESLKDRTDLEIKVLVGLDVDKKLFSILEYAQNQDSFTGDEKAESFFESLSIALNSDQLDYEEFYMQVNCFIGLIEQDRLKIRKTSEPNHAKLYLFKIKEHLQGIANCKFITGSSNLTRAGIREQNEFNVEIGDYGTDKAEEYFDSLWNSAILITEEPKRKEYLIDLIRNRSQAADVTPFEAYVKVLKTYVDLQKQKQIKPHVQRLLEDRGYKSYEYQSDAVEQGLTIIENYNGVIIADVVGLGKSIIASMIAKNLGKRGLIICPPGLIGDKIPISGWTKYKNDFHLHDWEIYSSGDLENAVKYVNEYGEDVDSIIIDEAHRYRNQDTQSYELLSAICRKRQVMLLTATPFNNTPADIFSLLKLFIVPGKSRITLDENLEARFSFYERIFRWLSFISKNYNSADPEKKGKAENNYRQLFDEEPPIKISKVKARAKELADEIRAVLEPIMIRRNRLDLKKDPVYCKEIDALSEVEEPKELFFELTSEQSNFYDDVINNYFGDEGKFTGAIYQPFFYEKEIDPDNLDEEDNRAFQQQRNLFDFMRRLLVKRFESSFGSFNQSIKNFISVHEKVLEFIKKTNGKYVLERKIIENAYEDTPEELEDALTKFAERLSEKVVPKHERIYDVNEFKSKKDFFANIESDIKLLKEVQEKVSGLNLVADDPKRRRVIERIKEILISPANNEPRRKIIVFSEYIDTVKHLKPVFETEFKEQVLTIAGEIGVGLNEVLLNDFDASIKHRQQKDDFQILLTSDKLSEGFNLNRAGAIINYDIPWNPTRVIQRVGRINRIGQKVFEKLQIYNFFPTEQGADIIKSRQIATQKMFLIQNTLGEDCKIFAADETPAPAELYKRINSNPEDYEEESLFTLIRSQLQRINEKYPEILKRVTELPNRIKTAKKYSNYNLLVFRRKALGLFIQKSSNDEEGKPAVRDLLIDSALELIQCDYSEKKLDLSNDFWRHYEKIKEYRQKFHSTQNEVSLEVKAMNNLQTALRNYKSEVEEYLPFIRDLIKDLRNYHTLPKYSLRRIANIELGIDKPKELSRFIREIEWLINHLGADYLEIIEEKVKDNRDEIIIAIENIPE